MSEYYSCSRPAENVYKKYMAKLLEVKNIYASYGAEQILKDVSIDIDKNEILGLVGESGSGKSTAARVITGLITPSAGKVLLDGEELHRKRDKSVCRRMQMVFQNPESSLNPKYRIGDILADAMSFHFANMSRDEIREKSEELVKRMELPQDTLSRYPRSFSGGQKQRIALMRALCVEPELLIADEPTSALDVSVQLRMLKLIKEIQMERSLGILFISHDLGVINYLCDKVAVMKEGQIVESGSREEFFRCPKTAYGKELLDSVPGGTE